VWAEALFLGQPLGQVRELIELSWESLPDDAAFAPPVWHLSELERRDSAADADPGAAEPWEAMLAHRSRKP